MKRAADIAHSSYRRQTPLARLLSALAALAMTVAGVGLSATAVSATAPGGDGKLALVRSNQIYTIRANGSGLVKLTSAGKNYRPKWSPNGQRIAYVNETAAGRKDLWVMNANGSGKQRVTNVGTVTTSGSWSPNGAKLAFAAAIGTDPWGFPKRATLHTVRSTSPFGVPVEMLGTYTDCFECDPENPSDPEPIPVDRFPAWSTDGTTIAVYNENWDAQVDNVLLMYFVATGEARQIAGSGAECCGEYSWDDLFWGPTNGLGYTFRDDGFEDPQPPGIYYSGTNSSPWGPWDVTDGFTSKVGDTGGAPSPSGLYMAFTSTQASSGVAKVYIANVDGSGRRVLTNGYQPDWQPRP